MAWLGRMREGEEREERGDGKEGLNRSGLEERGGVQANKFICHSHRNAVLLTPGSAPPPPSPTHSNYHFY